MDVRAGFWAPTAVVSSAAPFQLCLRCPDTVDISDLQFAALHIAFSDSRPDVVVRASGGDDFVDMGTISSASTIEASASLRWTAGKSLVLSAKVQSDVEGEVQVNLRDQESSTDRAQIDSVKLVLQEGSWTFQLIFTPGELEDWVTPKRSFAPVHELSPIVL